MDQYLVTGISSPGSPAAMYTKRDNIIAVGVKNQRVQLAEVKAVNQVVDNLGQGNANLLYFW